MAKRRITSAVMLAVTAIVACGCSDSHTATSSGATAQKSGLHLVAAPQMLLRKCRATARAVGYAVPCPTFIPAGLAIGSSTTSTGCLDVIDAGGRPACGAAAKPWRGWVVGTSNVGGQHLAITASPSRLKNYAKLVNGPAWYPRARVRPLGWVKVNGRRMRAIYVPPATNDGSMFMHHVVLVWNVTGHTYGFGFHDTRGIRRTLFLDKQLAAHFKLVRP